MAPFARYTGTVQGTRRRPLPAADFIYPNAATGSGASADNSPCWAADASPVTLVSDGKPREIRHLCFAASRSSVRPGVFSGPKSPDALQGLPLRVQCCRLFVSPFEHRTSSIRLRHYNRPRYGHRCARATMKAARSDLTPESASDGPSIYQDLRTPV